jgi:hypothetical protein
MAANNRVGGEVDAYCTRCKLLLAHTVLAIWADQIKRVRCNTCMGEHAFRAPPSAAGGSKTARPPTTRTRSSRAARPGEKPSASAVSYERLLAGRDASGARRYSPAEKFEKGDLVAHPTFGLGVVAEVRDDKVDLAFQGGLKTLQHMKGSRPAVLARPQPVLRSDAAVGGEQAEPPAADAPPEPELRSTQA